MREQTLPDNWIEVELGQINHASTKNIDPASSADEIFELYSVPSFPTGKPEIIPGKDIGSTKQTVEPDDVLVCKINPRINRVWVVKEKSEHMQIASSEWIVVRNSYLDPRFLRHFFTSQDFRDELCADVTGVGGSLTRAQPKRVAQICVPIAPRNEQRHIADKLDQLLAAADSCKTRLDTIPGIIKRFRQSVLAVATSGELTADWRKENKQTKWKSVLLNEICLSITDGDHQAPPQAESGIPFITISAINDGKLRLNKASRFVPPSYYEQLKSSRKPEIGDILFSVTGSIAIPAIVDITEPFTFQRHIAILKPDLSHISSNFLLFSLGAENIKNQALNVATGTAQLTIPLSGLRSFIIDLPAQDEQQEIVRRVEALFAVADRLEARYQTARAQVDQLTPSLLAKAFRGELVPQDPNDEPAERLLERIRGAKDATPVKRQTRRKDRQS